MAVRGLLRGRTYRRRYSRPKTHVRPRVIEMRNPSFQHHLEVTLIERNQKVQAFAAQCAAEALAHRIRLWRPYGCSQHPHSHGCYLFVQSLRENTVPFGPENEILSLRSMRGRRWKVLFCKAECGWIVHQSKAGDLRLDEVI